MSRIRSIKPEWLEDERLALLSSDARVLSVALLLLADDYGNGRANKVLLAGRVFPGKVPETLANALGELANVRFIVLYEVDGQQYFSIRNWSKHQRVDKPGKPHVPPPPSSHERSQFGGSAKVPESLAKVPETLAPDLDQDQDQDQDQEESQEESTLARTRRYFAELLSELGTFPSWSPTNTRHAKTIAEWANQHEDPVRALRAAFVGFQADAWAIQHRYPIGALANGTAKYHAAGADLVADEPEEQANVA